MESDQYQKARSISIFLSMPGKEASTSEIVLDAFRHGKTVFVPYIHKPADGKPKTMDMLQLLDEADFRLLISDSWGIPSLSKDSVEQRLNALGGRGIVRPRMGDEAKEVGLDLVFIPAVAFDRSHHRLGHGRGFYDRYLSRYQESSGSMPFLGKPHSWALKRSSDDATLAGLGLQQQLLPEGEAVPHNDDDWKVDLIVTPDGLL